MEDDEAGKSNGLFNDAMCNACETAVVWMQSQLAQNQTQDLVLQYINQVSFVACNTNGRIKLSTILRMLQNWFNFAAM